MNINKKIQGQPISENVNQQIEEKFLTLHNDNVNSFQYIIQTLIEVCEHDDVQAEQCTFIAHQKGRCDIKKGAYQYLRPMQRKLISKGIKATID